MDAIELIAEARIRAALQAGAFDNLPGAGKPLRLDDHPFEDPAERIAHHLLRSQGFTLPWIETRREIEAELEAARRRLAQARAAGMDVPAALEAFRAEVGRLNRRILSYNLQAPLPAFQLSAIRIEREIARGA